MLKVLFVNAVDPISEIESRYPPLWPGYLAAFARKHLGTAEIDFRFMAGTLETELDDYKPDIAAISSVTQNFNFARRHAKECKKKGITVIVGGPHISALPQSLSEDMDIGCIGEGEETFLELIQLFLKNEGLNKEALSKIKGVVFHDSQGYTITPPRPLIRNLDSIPHPDRGLVGYETDPYIVASRGCPYKCAYCASSRFWDGYRFASAEHVVEEIVELVNQGVKIIRFNDDLFVANKVRLKKIADLLAQLGLLGKVQFSVSCRANLITQDLVEILRRLNVVSVTMGLESGCDNVLKYLKGHARVKDNQRAVDLFREAGIQANAFFIIGSPNENEDEIMETYQFIQKSRVDFFNVYVLTPLPGTAVWEFALQKGLVSENMDWALLNMNFEYNQDRAIIVSQKLTRADIQRLYRKFRRLRIYRILRALPGSPWLRDVPRVALGVLREEVARLWRRVGK